MVQNTTTQVHFSNIEWEIKKILKNAKTSVKICVAWISHPLYNEIFSELEKKNVSIEILYNKDMLNRNINTRGLGYAHGIMNPFPRSLMHNKFCIVDDEIVITGSFNWSKSASYHFENIIVLRGDYDIVKSFKHEYEDLKFLTNMYQSKLSYSGLSRNTKKFRLGMIGRQEGKYEEVPLCIWEVDLLKNKATMIKEEYHQFLFTILFDHDLDSQYFEQDPKQAMINKFNDERDLIDSLQSYFMDSQNGVHAIGTVVLANANENIEYGELEDLEIHMTWIDICYKKVIPPVLYNDGCAEKIISESYY